MKYELTQLLYSLRYTVQEIGVNLSLFAIEFTTAIMKLKT